MSDVNVAADAIDAMLQPSPEAEPEAVVEAQPSPEPVEAEAEAEAPAPQVSHPDDAEDTDTVSQEAVDSNDQPSEADPEASPDGDFAVPETLSDLASALEVEADSLDDLRVTVKIDGEEIEVPSDRYPSTQRWLSSMVNVKSLTTPLDRQTPTGSRSCPA